MSSRHLEYLRTHCRVCGKQLDRSRFECNKYTGLLLHVGIDATTDDAQIHPESFCNTCRLRAKRISTSGGNTFPPTEWLPHEDDHCLVCDVKSKGGRPKKISRTGRPSNVQQHISSVASILPHFHLSQVIDSTMKKYVTCSSCCSAVIKPVQILPCKSLICSDCCSKLVSTTSTLQQLPFRCPGCSGEHESSELTFACLSPIEKKKFNDLLLRCDKCNGEVKLQCIGQQCDSHVQQIGKDSLTLQDVIRQPLDIQPSKLESTAAIKVVSRILHQNKSSTTCTLSTGGRVGKFFQQLFTVYNYCITCT